MNIEETIEQLVISAKRDVEKAIADSGLTKSVWLATSEDAINMLVEWEQLKEAVRDEYDIELPQLFEGVSVKLSNQGEAG